MGRVIAGLLLTSPLLRVELVARGKERRGDGPHPPDDLQSTNMPYQLQATLGRVACYFFVGAFFPVPFVFFSTSLVLMSARKSLALNGYRRVDSCPVVLTVTSMC